MIEKNDKVLINIPQSGSIIKAAKKKAYNHKITKVLEVCDDGRTCKLEIDDGKMEWPTYVLAVPVVR